MVGSLPRREHVIADQALAHLMTDDDEDLANLVAAEGACLSMSLFVNSHDRHSRGVSLGIPVGHLRSK